ncbi:unnamed protein product [Diabrotica balteata]|uniref:m7GpppX diphosphatase n=1 Tax=Diabrotica balteata TaxID=107213 RepID=A0A9N9T358_DIABA|nr:unnamed protein product [Diabrotica balteata]
MSASSCVEIIEAEISPAKKKSKLNTDENLIQQESIHNDLTDLSTFNISEILSNNTNRKTVCLRGSFDSKDGEAVVILEKSAFVEEDLKTKEYFNKSSLLEKTFQNDIYGDYHYFPNRDLSVIKTTVIHPATEKHIVKFSTQKLYIVDETPKLYEEVILPQLSDEQLHLQVL